MALGIGLSLRFGLTRMVSLARDFVVSCTRGRNGATVPHVVRQDKHKSRVTPKGTRSDRPELGNEGPSGVSRTPVKIDGSSPKWVPILMFAMFAIGIVAIMVPYLAGNSVSGGNWYILGGLGLILGGIITATQYR